MLVREGMITQDQLGRALTEHRDAGLKLGEYLIRQGIVSETQMLDVISSQLEIPKFNPKDYPLDLDLARLVPAEEAGRKKAVPVARNGSTLTVAMVDPLDIDTLDELEIRTNLDVQPLICTETDLHSLLNSMYGGTREGLNIVEEGAEHEGGEAGSGEAADVEVSALRDMAEDAPVIRLVNSLLAQAIRENASDVHLSPEKKSVQLRFRIDGKLQERPAPSKSMFLPTVSRLKILANMDIATSRIPQDGRFTVNMEGREINVRVSSVPTIHGENVVLRLLDMSTDIYTLDQLGMHPEDHAKMKRIISRPYGMILSTGPTGSGKTTSLYAILKAINTPDVNIITLEDPVEYRIPKIRQVQLNHKAGMTFASGLRSILRQDPDALMVGEIRDLETARIAVQAALTGHRLLSTMHTNDAAGAITRLIEMGIEPFLVSSSLLAAFSQRLVRKVCPYCAEEHRPDKRLLRYWGMEEDGEAAFRRGRGCHYCLQTGYMGRTGIFEILFNDSNVQEMVVQRASPQRISRALRKEGKLRTLKEDAREKARQGVTTLEEATQAVMI
jgi:type IV pilus assembly protein PilB